MLDFPRWLPASGVWLTAALSVSIANASVVVYDNTTTPTSGDLTSATQAGFWPFSVYNDYEYMGDVLQLAGSQREITQITIMLNSLPGTQVPLDGLTVALYSTDGFVPDSETPLWQSDPKTDVVVDGPTAVTFDVPNVVVPDVVAWAASAASMQAGLATYDPPTVGSSVGWAGITYYIDYDPYFQEWGPYELGDDLAANFGAQILAVPEPCTLILLASAAMPAVGRRRRRAPVRS
jgi:hypothetical protein